MATSASQSGEWRAWRESVARAALERAPVLLREWLPEGKLENGVFVAGSLSGDAGRSLKVWMAKGNWKDFANENDKGGNLVALFARIRNIPYREANEELAERFDIAKPVLNRVNRWLVLNRVPLVAPYDADGNPSLTFQLAGPVQGWWTYLSAEGEVIYHRVRIEVDGKKQFRPISFCQNRETGETAWQSMDQHAPRPLYGLELLAAMPEAPVLYVEGEKPADAGRILLPGWVVVGAGGASINGKNTDFSPLIERKTRKVLWPDADSTGVRHMMEVASILHHQAEIVQLDPSWRQHWDLADALAEGWDTARVLAYLETHLVPAAPPDNERVMCEISGSDLDLRSRAIFGAVAETQKEITPVLYQAEGELALVQQGRWQVADLPHLRQYLTSHINFQGRDSEGNLRSVTPGDTLLENVTVYSPSPLPRLKRLLRRPAFADDHRLIVQPGHDAPSGLLYLPGRGLEELRPGDDVEAAIELIDDLFCDFQFEAPSDRAHLYAMLLQPAFRELIDGPTPLYRFEAPQPGSGKTLLFETCAAVLFETGWPFITTPSSEDEWAKALLGHLRNGPEVLLIDNVHELKSYHLAAALTAWPYWSGRLLYSQGSFHVPVRNLWAATLNNPQLTAEMYRRSVRIRLASDSEHPEARTDFVHDPILSYVAVMRRELSEALLTLAVAAEKNLMRFSGKRLGSYESWVQIMGGALQALGIEHFLEVDEEDFAIDRQEAAWAEFIIIWSRLYRPGGGTWRVKDLLPLAQQSDLDLGQGKDLSQQQRLAKLLLGHRKAVVAGYKVVPVKDKHTKGYSYYLRSLNGHQPEQGEFNLENDDQPNDAESDESTPF